MHLGCKSSISESKISFIALVLANKGCAFVRHLLSSTRDFNPHGLCFSQSPTQEYNVPQNPLYREGTSLLFTIVTMNSLITFTVMESDTPERGAGV